MTRLRFILVLALLALPGTLNAAEMLPFVVVAHPSLPATNVTRAQLSRLFLRKSTNWPDGTAARPTDLPGDSPMREAFSQAVHKRSAGAVRNFWSAQLFSGGLTPPPERPTPEAVLAFVKANPGAVGYVPSATKVEGVKVLVLDD